jgi:Ala-tRNA(Pro) deacylase
MATERLTTALRQRGIAYEVLPHARDATASEAARDTHTPGAAFAKCVVLEADGRRALAVVPATRRIDLRRASVALRADLVTLADETVLEQLFPDCQVGAEPPFGNLYHLPVYVDPQLGRHERITFNAGRHDEAIRLRYADFVRAVEPRIADLVEA